MQMGDGLLQDKITRGNRDWWLIKYYDDCNFGYLHLNRIKFPQELVGKKIRLVVEVIEDD